ERPLQEPGGRPHPALHPGGAACQGRGERGGSRPEGGRAVAGDRPRRAARRRRVAAPVRGLRTFAGSAALACRPHRRWRGEPGGHRAAAQGEEVTRSEGDGAGAHHRIAAPRPGDGQEERRMNMPDTSSSYPKEPSAMEQEINHTRERIGRTVAELEQRLSPGQLMDQALGYARDHGGHLASSVASAVGRNPLPVIVTGIGVMWMLKTYGNRSSGNGHARAGSRRIYTPYDSPYDTPYDTPYDIETDADAGYRTYGGGNGHRRGGMREKLSGVGEALKSKVAGARSTVASATSSASERLQSARDSVSSRMHSSSDGDASSMGG